MCENSPPYELNEIEVDPDNRGRTGSLRSVLSERALLKALINQLPDFLFIKDTSGRFIVANESIAHVYGFSAAGLVGKTDYDLHPKERADLFYIHEQEIIVSGIPKFNMEETFPDSSGIQKWYSTTKLPLRDKSGATIGLIGIARDVTARKKMEVFEARQSKMLEMIAANVPLEHILSELVLFIESQTVRTVASIMLLDDKTGHLRAHLAIAAEANSPCDTAGHDAALVSSHTDPLRRDYVPEIRGLRGCWSAPIISHHGDVLGEIALCSDSAHGPAEDDIRLVQTASRMAGLAVERRRSEAQLGYMAHHDSLTSLANRVLFISRLQTALQERRAKGHCVALHYIDLDDFKKINDGFGHSVGDAFLRQVGSRLRATVAPQHTVARLGGDEFAVIQILTTPTIHDESAQLTYQILDALSLPYQVEGKPILGGASIGVAIAPEDDEDPEALLRDADLALYQAKANLRGSVRFYEPVMALRAQQRRILEEDLRRALNAGEFELYYQPQIDLASNEICGFEALLRWRHPERGMVSPLEFIGVAEEIGLIVPLGAWVISQACAEAATWARPIKIAVNLSPVQFRNHGLLQTVVSALSSSGLPPDRLELEITESVLLIDSEPNAAVLHQLRTLGIRISLDDFGTGYCSLSYLRTFPFTKIKIDQTFVHDLCEDRGCLAIVRAISHLASDLGMRTTAEGVETVQQLDQLRSEGCDEGQGYLFSPPVSASRAALMLLRPASAVFDAA